MKRTRCLTLALACSTALTSVHATDSEVYTDWYSFLTTGLKALSDGTATSCTFEAKEDVRMEENWTGNNGSAADPIPGTIVMDGNGLTMSGGSGVTFGAQYAEYTGNLTVRNWADWYGFKQMGSGNKALFKQMAHR